MRITVSKLRQTIRKVIREHIDDGSHKLMHGKVPAVSEPHKGYVEDYAEMYAEDGDWEGYIEFGQQYGYTEEELAVWLEAAEDALFQQDVDAYEPELVKRGSLDPDELEEDLRTGKIDLVRNPYALD